MPFAAALLSQVTLALDIPDRTPVVNQFAEISTELEGRGRGGRGRRSCDERAEDKAEWLENDCNGDAACEGRVADWLLEEQAICDMSRGCE